MQVSRSEQLEAAEAFRVAVQSGDLQGLLDVLAPEVVLVADGGGVANAVRHPVSGAERVSRLLVLLARFAPEARVHVLWLNGAPALRLDIDGELDTAISLSVEGGRIIGIYAVRNPDKLARLGTAMQLSRH
jgi:RNA polymerase sigma-70 factor (ECF subfamily)